MAKEIQFEVDIELLKASIARQVDRTDRNRFRDKSRTTIVTVMTAIGGAMTSTLIGLSKFVPAYENVLQAIALVTGGLMAVVVAWDRLFDHRKLWIISSKGNRRFLELSEDILHAEETDTLTSDLAKAFYLEYKDALQSMNEDWDRLRTTSRN
ncbi:MAG: SLATT domain-containing protein [Tateyamaria sp.]|uniref:SLATT domain-containing protein n=1 Tax=Tateyamaria sp. TaxID=1929288 RepID=UPI00329CAF50